MSALELRQVSLTLAGKPLMAPLSFRVEPGSVLVLCGPSGVGKSSLLAYLCGVLRSPLIATGSIFLGDEDISGRKPQDRRLGILFQDDLLFPHLSVRANLAFGLRTAGVSRSERMRRVEEALDSVGLSGFGERDPATLSGGQKARISLLRVLLSQPRALLLDEPFGHLDALTRTAVREVVFAEIRRRGLPAVLVTHDEEDARVSGGQSLKLLPGEEPPHA